MTRSLLLISLFLFGASSLSVAQDATNYYVTIGVFAKLGNTTRLTEKANKQSLDANYAMNPSRSLHYVYVLNTTEKRKAFALAIKLRAETEYKDAWVYEGKLGEAAITKDEPVPIAEEKPKEPIVEIKPVAPEVKPIIEPTVIDSTTIVKQTEEVKPVEMPVEKKPTGIPFYFKLVSVADGSEVKSGQVHIQETVRATQYQAFKVGEVVYLEAPKNTRGSYTVITQVPGYSPISTVFNYKNPAGEKGSLDETIIELPVTKAKRGDYIDFNNVKFFKNASILQAASQNELDGLVDLMKENTKYKIKVHGHVNGNQNRESFVRGQNSAFFSTNPSNDKAVKNMSPKDLSTFRAETIKDYLVSQGIDASRISVKGEGSKIPLYPEGGTLGQFNDRIEIEFIKH
jgi:outer membrane protein OmpA-like peptidoglycan-associated protein